MTANSTKNSTVSEYFYKLVATSQASSEVFYCKQLISEKCFHFETPIDLSLVNLNNAAYAISERSFSGLSKF